MERIKQTIAETRKALYAAIVPIVVAAVAEIVSKGVPILQTALTSIFLGAGVYATRNTPRTQDK
jgi:hypothetical protein